jgi:DNA-binding NtrC family response regulator
MALRGERHMTPSTQAKIGLAFEKTATQQTGTQDEFRILIVSADLESRRKVSKILEALSVDTICCSTLTQAAEVLLLQSPQLIFCDENLPDGCYADLLESKHPGSRSRRMVVLTRTGEWDLYMVATRRGAFDVIRDPWCPTDIELSLIRALRAEKYKPRTIS